VLKWPDILKPFILITDASDHTISGILSSLTKMETHSLVLTDSFKLKAAQLSWTVGEKEMFAGIRCMQLWRCYLLNMEFQWWTDHDNLRYWSTKAELSPRLIRWLDNLENTSLKFCTSLANPIQLMPSPECLRTLSTSLR
jgi:hypothetical protein